MYLKTSVNKPLTQLQAVLYIVNRHLFYAAAELATCSMLARCGYGTLEALPPNYWLGSFRTFRTKRIILLQGTKISHLGKENHLQKWQTAGDMLVPGRTTNFSWSHGWCWIHRCFTLPILKIQRVRTLLLFEMVTFEKDQLLLGWGVYLPMLFH